MSSEAAQGLHIGLFNYDHTPFPAGEPSKYYGFPSMRILWAVAVMMMMLMLDIQAPRLVGCRDSTIVVVAKGCK